MNSSGENKSNLKFVPGENGLKFTKFSEIKPNAIYTILRFFICKSPLSGYILNAVLDDNQTVRIPSFRVNFNWTTHMESFQKKRNFLIFEGMKTSKNGFSYPVIRFPSVNDWNTCCFCSTECTECRCNGYFDTHQEYTTYTCLCTEANAFDLKNICRKIFTLNEEYYARESVIRDEAEKNCNEVQQILDPQSSDVLVQTQDARTVQTEIPRENM